MIAYDLRRSLPATDEGVQQARELYTEAAAETRGYLQGIAVDARLKQTVDEPLEKYKSHPASVAVDKFLAKAAQVRGSGIGGATVVAATAVADFAANMIVRIDSYNRDKLKAEIDQFEKDLESAYPLSWDDLDESKLTRKYEQPKP